MTASVARDTAALWRRVGAICLVGALAACAGDDTSTGGAPRDSGSTSSTIGEEADDEATGDAVCFVTNTDDAGPGSLRDCVERPSPPGRMRYVVFRVGGTIELGSSLDIDEEHGRVHVAGQTASGGGITITGATSPQADALCESLLTIDGADDVVIRFLRFRGVADPSCRGVRDMDVIEIRNGATNVVVDHNSFTWGVDDVVGLWTDESNPPNRDITIAYNIVAEGLDDSIHREGPHSMGIHVSGRVPRQCYEEPARVCTEGGTSNVVLHHNLVVSSANRMPELNAPNDGVIDMRNNVVYNWRGETPVEVSSKYCGGRVNIVHNVFKRGPSSSPTVGSIVAYEDSEGTAEQQCDMVGGVHDDNLGVYFDGNIVPSGWTLRSPELDGCDGGTCTSSSAWPADAAPTTPAAIAFGDVLARAGPRRPLYEADLGWGHPDLGWNYAGDLDDVDRRLVDEAASCVSGSGPECAGAAGSITDDPLGVGAAPATGKAYADADADGMYDRWESTVCAASLEQCAPFARDLDPARPNIEMFLRDLVDGYGEP